MVIIKDGLKGIDRVELHDYVADQYSLFKAPAQLPELLCSEARESLALMRLPPEYSYNGDKASTTYVGNTVIFQIQQ